MASGAFRRPQLASHNFAVFGFSDDERPEGVGPAGRTLRGPSPPSFDPGHTGPPQLLPHRPDPAEVVVRRHGEVVRSVHPPAESPTGKLTRLSKSFVGEIC